VTQIVGTIPEKTDHVATARTTATLVAALIFGLSTAASRKTYVVGEPIIEL